MRLLVPVTCSLILLATPARAADPTGDWRVEDGTANIRIANCGGSLWGVVAWEKVSGGRDAQNPDPALRDRPTLGLPILLDMKQTSPQRWEGRIYNAENGKMYTGSIRPIDANTLRVEGCVLGFLCGGQDWTRVAQTAPAPQTKGVNPKVAGKAGASMIDVCSRISNLSGRPH